MSNRVQQVLKDARAMVDTHRPETPIVFVPPMRSLSISRSRRNLSIRHVPCSGAASLALHRSSLSVSTPTINMSPTKPSSLSSSNSISILVPEIEILEQSDRECTEVVTVDCYLGKLWRESLLNSNNVNLSCKAAAIILRHCEDELVDETLTYLLNRLQDEGDTTQFIGTIKAEGTIDSLIIAVRSSHFLSLTHLVRLQKTAELFELITSNEQMHPFLVTHGIFQSISEALCFILKEYNICAKISSESNDDNIIKLQGAADLFLLTLRNLCESSFAHHVLKVGLVKVLIQALNSYFVISVRVLCKLSFDDDCLANFTRDEEISDSLVRALVDTPQDDCITQARILMTLSRIIDGNMSLTRDMFLTSWGIILPYFMTTLGDVNNTCNHSNTNYSVTPEMYKAYNEAKNEMWCSALSLMSALTLYHEAGEALMQSDEAMCILQNFVEYASSSEHCVCDSKSTEVLNLSALRLSLMCLSNASFYLPVIEASYLAPSEQQEFKDIIHHLSMCVSGFLFEGDAEATVEATKTLGNISSVRAGKEWLLENECDNVCALFLNNTDHRLVYNCIGILVNLTSDGSLIDQYRSLNSVTVALILQYTQKLLEALDTPWEIKDLVEILLRNIQTIIDLQ